MGNKLTIYVPADLQSQLKIIPGRKISRICQEALRSEVKNILQERDEFIADSFAED